MQQLFLRLGFLLLATMATLSSAQLGSLTCDRLILGGMADCLKKFAPTSDPNPCCAYRKFRACNDGLKSGLKLAGQRAGCSSSFLAKTKLNSMADRLTGASLAQCGDSKKICRKSSTTSSSSSSSTSKAKKPSSSSRSKPKTPTIGGDLLGGNSPLDSLNGPISSMRDGFSSMLGSSPLSRGTSRTGSGGGVGSILGSSRGSSPLDSFMAPISSMQEGFSSLLGSTPLSRASSRSGGGSILGSRGSSPLDSIVAPISSMQEGFSSILGRFQK